jgi:hypothetical protein
MLRLQSSFLSLSAVVIFMTLLPRTVHAAADCVTPPAEHPVLTFFGGLSNGLNNGPLPKLEGQNTSKLVFSGLEGTDGAKLIQSLAGNVELNQKLQADNKLWAQIANTRFPGDHFDDEPGYMNKIRNGVGVNFLFEGLSGVDEGYTIGQHTSRVLDVYERQKNPALFSSIHTPVDSTDLDKLMRFTLVFHDIGKSIAAKGGDKSQEILYSTPIAKALMTDLSFKPEEVKIAASLINTHQDIGTALEDPGSLASVKADILKNAHAANVSPKDFFQLMKMVYTADAASYDYIRSNYFTESADGRLLPKDLATLGSLEKEIDSSK